MAKLKKTLPRFLSLALALCMTLTAFSEAPSKSVRAEYLPQQEIAKVDYSIDTNIESYFDDTVVTKLPSTVSDNQDISVIVEMNVDGLLDSYNKTSFGAKSVFEYSNTKNGRQTAENVEKETNRLLKILRRAGVKFSLGEKYETLFGGFEITIKAKDFERLNNLLDDYATLMIGEVYNPCESVVVENVVDVYDTGIFDSSSSQYQGDGVVVAVLDTGLDYTHQAFDSSEDNFTTTNEKFDLNYVSEKIDNTAASKFTSGLTAEDVYLNRKVPYAYDYGDHDPDVLPIDSEHGTHVAGIIAGKDDTITGVAPNAQLAIMKVFSDTQQGAKTSALLAALEDCVVLGVDVINMSLGSGCGFTREVDKENVNKIYDKIHEEGISLIASAANSYNATFGSEKNGSNGLTSNPDSGTVGSPSTYNGPLSVASVDGVKTPYLLYGEDIIYFNEASTNDAEQKKSFVDDVLKAVGNVDSYEFDYVTIPGVGKTSDYAESDDYYQGKIVLVKRGQNTFEEKVRVALTRKRAAGIIIYNNVSGTISMSVGADVGAVCSISQDDGEKLAKNQTGKITISRSNTAGPFMSDFSSWGPTSDLKIKPEITAHGGEIYSAIPGGGYESLSGTSMAAPNQAGATALIRQYVQYSGVFGSESDINLKSKNYVNSIVNKLMMSTADIVMNKNGLPYAVRKQGAGLVNITKATTTASYVTTYDQDGNEMDKTKLELGDDRARTGVYEMTFGVTNVSQGSVSYDVGAIVMTEGVSSTYTSHGDTTVTQDGYLLKGTTVSVTKVEGGSQNGNNVTVSAGETAKVSVKIVLSDEDKQYIADSFEHGMYVEGFVTLDAVSGTEVNMSVPMLAFYGDWTEAPIFDEEYYDTNKDEVDSGIDADDKLMADAYATRAIGGLYSDYITTLGSYYFAQDSSAKQIAASKDHIALSNQSVDDSNWTISSINSINAGLLRNAKEVIITITEDATGRVIFNHTESNQQKSYSSGSTVYPSSIDVDFSVLENNLKNNTKYTVKVEAYIDYGEKEDQNNVRNTFEFPVYIDYEAPAVTDVKYRTEYDKNTKKTKLYADIYVYDNHYAMGMSLGQITRAEEGSTYMFTMNSFGKYVTPIYSEFNSTSMVTVELTDYVSQIKKSVGLRYTTEGNAEIVDNNNCFIVNCYDYAMNSATYEIKLPDEIMAMYFEDVNYCLNEDCSKFELSATELKDGHCPKCDSAVSKDAVRLSPYETKDLTEILNVYPSTGWVQTLDYSISDDNVCDVVNGTLVGKSSGSATVTVIGKNTDGDEVTTMLNVVVLAKTDKGFKDHSKDTKISRFEITGFKTNKAYYGLSSEDREIGETGDIIHFGDSCTLSMFPSESVTLRYVLDTYFKGEGETTVEFKSSNDKVTVDKDGTIVAQKKGSANVSVTVYYNDGAKQSREAFKNVSVTVKDPFKITSIYLYNYKGLGGDVEIPADRGLTTIYDYAFSNYKYVEKDTSKGDVIDEENPYLIKQAYIGEDTIKKVIIPEGITTINQYAFANLSALEEVVLPSTLTKIGVGAFYDCKKLSKINLENVQFINENAFANCESLKDVNLAKVVAIGNYTFANTSLSVVTLPKTSQSLGIGAFYGCNELMNVEFAAPKIKIGTQAFMNCKKLTKININAAVVSANAFAACEELSDVTLGKDVAVIGQYAFAETKVESFKISPLNELIKTNADGKFIYSKDGKELILAAPKVTGSIKLDDSVTKIALGAFAANKAVDGVQGNNVEVISNYAFAYCTNLKTVTMPKVTEIGDYAFFQTTNLKTLPDFTNVKTIGNYAFYACGVSSTPGADGSTVITEVVIPANCKVGELAFATMTKLEKVTVGNGAQLGDGAFFMTIGKQYYAPYDYIVEGGKTYTYYRFDANKNNTSSLTEVVIGDDVTIGMMAFANNMVLTTLTLGDGVKVGERAFYNDVALETVDLSKVESIGNYAFSGQRLNDLTSSTGEVFDGYAYERVMQDGVEYIVGYVYTTLAPNIKTVNLEGVTSVGEGAFAFNGSLQTLTLNQNATAVNSYAFAYCSSLETLTLPTSVTEIGKYAFTGTTLTEVDLSNVVKVGDYAFASTDLKKVTLNEAGVALSEGAFAYNSALNDVENLHMVTEIGSYAFASSALTEVSLDNATTIGDYAFKNSVVTKVTFGDKLNSLGENPFNGCQIESFGRYEDVLFNGKVVGKQFTNDYNVSETVTVIDGVLYQLLPSGQKELVSFPIASEIKTYVVLEGTARIAANAFEGANLASVMLPTTLKSIGHKAFYDMPKLSAVTFLGYDAPSLEEEYDVTITYDPNNLPLSGIYSGYEGLGIVDYYMWNAYGSPNNFYYGANFADYIGKVEQSITMIAPSNGQGYDTFIFQKYFSDFVQGKPAKLVQTNTVIDILSKLPKDITLEDEATVAAARAAYNALSTEQQSLIEKSLVDTLLGSESMIDYLKKQQTLDTPVDGDNKVTNDKSFVDTPLFVIIMTLVGIVIGCGIAILIYVIWQKKGNRSKNA